MRFYKENLFCKAPKKWLLQQNLSEWDLPYSLLTVYIPTPTATNALTIQMK